MLSVLLIPVGSNAEPWSLGVAGGYADRFHLTTRSAYGREVGEWVPAAFVGSIHVLRAIGPHFNLSAQGVYLPYGDLDNSTSARHLVAGFGIRYSPDAGTDRRGRLFLELGPALAWSRWNVNYYGEEHVTAMRPGLVAGFGVHGRVAERVGLEGGVRYLLSANAKESSIAPGYSHTLEGLGQGSILLGVYYEL